MFETPNSSLSYNNQQDEDPVSHLNEKEQSCVKLANPPSQTSNQKKKKD